MNPPNYISPHFQKVHYPSSSIRDFRAAEGLNGGQVGEPVTLVNVTKTEYMYKYQGQERQDELGLNMYAMDMRQYDPAIARWVVQDPIVHLNQSPYSSFDGNPVYWADPSGAATTIREMWDETPEGGSTYWVNTGDGNFEQAEEDDENDDIIIYGTDGNQIRIVTGGKDVPFFAPFALGVSETWDFGLGYIDVSRFGIGYSLKGNIEISAIAGANLGGGIVAVNFFNDDYGYYLYHYLEGDFDASGGVQAGGNANLELNFFLIYNTATSPNYNPRFFAGESTSVGLSFDAKAVFGGGISAYGFKSGDWHGIAIGANAGFGGSVNFGSGFVGKPNSILLNNVKKTRERTWGDKFWNKVSGPFQAVYQFLNN